MNDISNLLVHFFNMIVNMWVFVHAHYPALQHQLAQSGGHYHHALWEFRHWLGVLFRMMT